VYRLEHSEYLIGLGALPLLVAALVFLLGWKKRTAARMGDPALIRQLIGNFSPRRFLFKAIAAILAFGVIIVAAANPQKSGAMENVQRKGVDVMLVLDVSKSMLAKDIKPSRLDKAKQFLLLLSEKLNNDRIGLILFAGRAYLQMPLTTDHGAARMYIQDASPDAVPTQGTVFGEALRMANAAFNSKERKYKSIVLVSDGEDHDPEALKEAQQLAQNGVMINTVGIGSPEGSPIIDPATNELKKDEQGNTVVSKLNEAELQQLSNATNGEYIRLDNIDDALITISQRIDSAEKKSMSDSEFIDYNSYFQWFAGAALLLLLVEFFFSERRREKKKTIPVTAEKKSSTPVPSAQAMVLAVAILAASLPAMAQSANSQAGNALLRSGSRYYKKKLIEQSLRQYQSAVQQAPDNPTANYDLGNAQFRENKYDEAAHSYDAAIRNSPNDKDMKEKGYYNKGVSMIKQKKLQESIDSWKEALKLDANDADARENLEKALMQQKQQQQQQQQQNKNDQKKEQKEKKEEKKDQEQQQQEQPKPQPSRLNKQQVEQLLKALEQKENDLQNKMKQNKVKAPNQPEKDW
jgi:Ca-activated chloride channel family protein